MIRYNTDVELFEGYINDSWSIIGGVIDSDKDTFIKQIIQDMMKM